MSTAGMSPPFSFVISPSWSISGKCSFVIAIGAGSISLAQRGLMPFMEAASGNTPMPSNKLPSVSINSFHREISFYAMPGVVFISR